jgi:precorrin-3B methylase
MRTVVVVGNSATARLGDRLVTGRGYAIAEPTGGRPVGSGGHG